MKQLTTDDITVGDGSYIIFSINYLRMFLALDVSERAS